MKKMIFIVTSILVVVCVSIFLAYQFQKDKEYTFNKDGYILVSNVEATASKYYFSAGSTYQEKYPAKIVFTDIDQNKVVSDNTNFVHYTDGSIAVLKKSAILDLSNINGELVNYYNLFVDTELSKKDTNYRTESTTGTYEFTNFIVKVSDSKYLLVGDNMTLRIGEENTVTINGYLELSIVEGDIILLENQEVSYKTVSSDARILFNENTYLNLQDHGIYNNDERVITLEELTIDSDDNIQIIPEPEEEVEPTPTPTATTAPTPTPTPTSGTITIPGGGGNGGNGNNGTNDNNDDDQIEDTAEDPVFSVEKLEVTANKVEAEITVTDNDSLLYGAKTIRIVEVDTGRTIYQVEETTGNYQFNIVVESLNPETNYMLIITADYIKNGIMYTRDFVSKSFRTENIGLKLNKEYFTDTSLHFTVTAEDYSNIKSAQVMLLNKDNEVLQTIDIDGTIAKTAPIPLDFTNLTPNTTYKIKFDNFLYDGAIIVNQVPMIEEAITLKTRPTLGTPNFVIDKREGSVTLQAGQISDEYHGIESYRYEIYDARTLNENLEPVKTITKSSLSDAQVYMDEQFLFRGVPYVYRLIVDFNDNEKIVEMDTGFSSVFKMDGVAFPTISFQETNVTFERIEGILEIQADNNTVSLDPSTPITIIYQDSVGNKTTFTTANSLTIPFQAAGLRANETYTISVYATVNLQDGNPPLESCYIGSVYVQTKEPNPFLLESSVSSDEVQNSFYITAKLGSEVGVDTTLEANTLTGITFNLYEGKNTNGKLVRTVKSVDRNTAPYESDLKEQYYDKEFVLNPNFFGLKNQDLTSEYYTITVEQAYDYTDYKNEFEIKQNTITVKANGYVPDLPTDPEKTISISPIYNMYAEENYREDLDAETIVGYTATANYDNSRNYAKYFNYYLHDKDGNVIDSITNLQTLADGSVPTATFYLKDGTSMAITDNDFRRGNEYYISYEAYLDLNSDGVAETKYPLPNDDGSETELTSPRFSPPKQEAKFKIYLADTTENTMTWKYQFSDIDHSLVTNQIYAQINDFDFANYSLAETTEDQWQTLTIERITPGYFKLYVNQALDKKTIENKTLVYQMYEKPTKLGSLQYQMTLGKNRLTIAILNASQNESAINRIAALKLTFNVDGKEPIVLDNLPLENNSVTIDLSEISEFMNDKVHLKVEAYYDTGVAGFETTGYHTLQQITNKDGGGNYLKINPENNLSLQQNTNGIMYESIFSKNTLELKSLVDNRQKTLDLEINESGVIYNYDTILLKQIDIAELIPSGDSTFTFDSIIPGVSLLNENGRLDIAAALKYAEVKIKLFGTDASPIQNNTIYLDVFETNESGTTENKLTRIAIPISELDQPVTIPNLVPNTNYLFKLFAYIETDGEYHEEQLYDVDDQTNQKSYYFKTLNEIGIDDLTYSFDAISYNEKYLTVQYTVDRIVGYDEIRYDLYEIDDQTGEKTKVDLNIDPDILFKYQMQKKIEVPLGSILTQGKTYILKITPISKVIVGGESREIVLDVVDDFEITIPRFQSAFVGITKSIIDDETLEFKVSIQDIYKVVVDGKYTVRFENNNGDDITPDEYKNIEYSINDLNRTFRITGLEKGAKYKIIVTTYQDIENNITSASKKETELIANTLSETGIDLGDIYTSVNADYRSKIDLSFYNSYQLNYANVLRYSIYSLSGYASDNYVQFTPTLKTEDGTSYYVFTLPESLPSTGLYYLELQFLHTDDDGEVLLGQKSIEHNYQ